MSKNVVAMILAGGKGTRLESLTKKTAKPAVSFAAKYRIIDFPLSNCANTGINKVGVLTQYESIDLDRYIELREKVKENMQYPEWLGDFSKEDLIYLLNNNSKIWIYYLENEPVCSMMLIP